MQSEYGTKPSQEDEGFLARIWAQPLTAIACLLCIAICIGLNMSPDRSWERLAQWGLYRGDLIWTGKPYALITSTFVHFEIWHIAFNLYWLWLLGGIFERRLGMGPFLLFFLGAAWVSSAGELMLMGATGIGMSGVGYALFGFGWMARGRIAEFNEILDNQSVTVFLVWLFGCVALTYFGILNIANGAHFFGLFFGAAVGLAYTGGRAAANKSKTGEPIPAIPAAFATPGNTVSEGATPAGSPVDIPGRAAPRWQRPAAMAAVTALLGGALLSLFWCPRSPDWNSVQAMHALARNDLPEAAVWWKRTLDRGGEPAWVWHNLALIAVQSGQEEDFAEAMQELRKADPKVAGELAARLKAGM